MTIEDLLVVKNGSNNKYRMYE